MKKEAELASAETAEAKKEFTEAESEAAKVSEKFPALEGLSKLQYAEHAAETKIYEDQFKNMVRELHESERRATVESELASEFLQELRARTKSWLVRKPKKWQKLVQQKRTVSKWPCDRPVLLWE